MNKKIEHSVFMSQDSTTLISKTQHGRLQQLWSFSPCRFVFTFSFPSFLQFHALQTGFALVESGVVRSKNEVNIMMKNVVDVCFGGLSFYIFGFGLMFGRGEYTNSFFGFGDFIVDSKVGDPLMAQVFTHYFYQMSFATTSTTIVSGACAERFRFPAYILFSFVNTGVYAVAAGWVW